VKKPDFKNIAKLTLKVLLVYILFSVVSAALIPYGDNTLLNVLKSLVDIPAIYITRYTPIDFFWSWPADKYQIRVDQCSYSGLKIFGKIIFETGSRCQPI
jgi:hypothetical protein